MAYDWSKFTKRINIKAGVQDIYNAWTTQGGMERWFLRKAEFTGPDGKLRERNSSVQKGDTYLWMWHGYGDEVFENRKIVEANGKDLLQFMFTNTCLVTVRIKTEGGESIVELSQENIPLDEESRVKYHLGCMEGWTFYLANLKSILEGGIDLRNKKENLKNVVNS